MREFRISSFEFPFSRPMNFLNPGFFWVFAALLPLALIYFLKVRPRRKPTTAYFLWEQIFSQKKTSALFNRLRDLLSLLLMILAFSAVALALTNPEFTKDERKDLLLVVDHSASMSASQGGASRLELAKNAASEIVLGTNDSQRVAVAAIGREVEFQSHLSNHTRESIDAIESIEPTDFPLNIEALEAILQSEEWSQNYRVLFFTDGAFDAADDLPETLEIVKIGESAQNIGITAADLQRIPGGPNRVGFFFRVASTFEETVEADLVLQHRESSRIFKLIPLKLEAGESAAQTFVIEDAPAGHWTAKLDLDDAFATDNTAFLSLLEREPITVAVSAEERFFLENSVLAFQQSDGLLALGEGDVDIVLGRGNVPETAAQSVVIQPDGESPFWASLGEEIIDPVPEVLLDDHPILRFVDAGSLEFIGARELETPEGSLVLIASEAGAPLAYIARVEGRSALVLNLDPAATSFYFSAWFPVLIHGAATHLAGRDEELLATYQPGSEIPVPGAHEDTRFFVSPPGGGGLIESAGKRFGPVSAVGFYEFRNDEGEWAGAASLGSLAESLLGAEDVETTAQAIAKGRAPAYWLLILAILVLVAESVLYHRRRVG